MVGTARTWSGQEAAKKHLADVDGDLVTLKVKMQELSHIIANFDYPADLNSSRKLMQEM